MSVFTHLNELGEKIYEEVVHDIDTVEAWINQHFGSAPIPAGHVILKDGEAVAESTTGLPPAPKAEEPKAEEPRAEEPKAEEPKAEDLAPGPVDLVPAIPKEE